MLRNYLSAALRNLWRNRLYSALNIAGLAVGFTAGLLIALYVHDETTFDRFWPHYDQAYLVSTTITITGDAPWDMDGVPTQIAAALRPRLPAGVVMARVAPQPHAVRRAGQEAIESITWADPELFQVLRPEVVAGDLDDALTGPDGLVLTQHIARKYFGDADPLGQTLTLDREHVLTVRAVVRDIPASSFFSADLFGSAKATFAGLGARDLALQDPKEYRSLGGGTMGFLRLPSSWSPAQAEAALQASADEVVKKIQAPQLRFDMKVRPVAAVHLSPPAMGSARGDPTLLTALALIGVAIVAMAAINFVNLMTARATRRATEIGVRKAQGATPQDLVVQFIGESMLYSGIAMLIAFAAVELLLPAFNGFLQRNIALEYGPDLAFCLGVALLTGAMAGFYPALVLARFRPALVLRGVAQGASGGRVRQILVVLQFAVLIGLALTTLVVHEQVQYALNEGLRFDRDQALMIETPCKGAFVEEIRKLQGVLTVACSGGMPLGNYISTSGAAGPDGTEADVRNEAVGPGLLDMFGIHPVAGRFFAKDHPDESLDRNGDNMFIGPVVINEAAVRKLHLASARVAVGQVLRHARGPHTTRTDMSVIIGVAPDVPMQSVREQVQATVFHSDTSQLRMLAVKLTGRQVPETLAHIDALWRAVGEPRPINRVFVDQAVQERYDQEVRQGQMFAAFAGVALFIACLGLFGLAAFTAERRTKEIGVRKALGASRGAIVWMLLWQLTRPVLMANLVAWPLGFYLMSRWLSGFAYHIELAWWMFLASGLLALLIAWATVSTHAFLVAHSRPVTALRYE
jgi:putative ABC transport system permease protein